MNFETLKHTAAKHLSEHPHNYVQAQDAIRDELIGIRIYDDPVFAVGTANDPLFDILKSPEVIYPDYLLPQYGQTVSVRRG